MRLCLGLGARIGIQGLAVDGIRFRQTILVHFPGIDGRRRHKHKASAAGPSCRRQQAPGHIDIDRLKVRFAPPRTRQGCAVQHALHPGRQGVQVGIHQIRTCIGRTQPFQVATIPSPGRPDGYAARKQPGHQGLAQSAAGPCHQNRFCRAGH